MLEIRLLGSFQVSLSGKSVEGFRSDKVRALLAFLVSNPSTQHRREILAAKLWPDSSPSAARVNLRSALANLRQVLHLSEDQPDILHSSSQTICFEPNELIFIDIDRFVKLAGSAQPPRDLEEAVALYRGPFMDGLTIKGSETFDDWLLTQGEYFQRLAVSALHRLAVRELEIGDHSRAITHASRQIELEPWEEEGHRTLMSALVLARQRNSAVAHYQRYKKRLAAELGVEPAAETMALYEKISTADFDMATFTRYRHLMKGYELRQSAGGGSLGIVYFAYQPVVNRQVAIKIIHPEIANQAQFIRGFESRAHQIARLEHSHIVPLYDYWRDQNGTYLVMRWMSAGSLLDTWEKGSWNIPTAVQLVNQVCAALSAAHQQGLIHGNIKPANILLDEQGGACLSDFSLAGHNLGCVEHSHLPGSTAYLSPENMRPEPLTPAADIFSLGILLQELLGRIPGEIPPQIYDVIAKATCKDPDERYQTALSLAEAVHKALEGESSLAVLPRIQNPYKGLRPFQEGDAADFFGREALINELIDLLAQDGSANRFLAIVGPSGSGKSSLVRAGVIPALRRGEIDVSEDWFIATMTPGNKPFEALETALLRIAINPPESLLELLMMDERGLHRAVRRTLPDDESTLLLVIDQFEELFLHIEHAAQQDLFLENLKEALIDPQSQLRAIITLRADFFDRPLEHPGLGELFRGNTHTILPMTEEDLKRAIISPAERVAVRFEPGLVDLIIKDTGLHMGALPALQYALTEAFDCREADQITLKAYTESGGVRRALPSRAEALYQSLDPERQETARQVLLHLVGLDERFMDGYHAPLARKKVARKELLSIHSPDSEAIRNAGVEQVLDMLGGFRLLIFDYDPATREPVVELAHEALIQEWERLQEWITESWEDIQLHRRLSAAAAEWSESNRSADYLLRGSRLELFNNWSEATSLELTEGERALLDESLRAAEARQVAMLAATEKEKRLERRSNRILRILVSVLLVALIISLSLAGFAWYSQSRVRSESRARTAQQAIAEQQARIAAARELAMAALRNLERDPDLSILLAIESVEKTLQKDGFIIPEAENALHQAVQSQRIERIIQSPEELIYMVDFSPDGRYLVSAGFSDLPWEQAVRIWEIESGEQVAYLPGFLQRDQWGNEENLVTLDITEGKIFSWNPISGAVRSAYPSPDFGGNLTVAAGNMSPETDLIAVSFSDGITQVWAAKTGEILLRIPSENGFPHTGIEFSPDGSLLALGNNEGQIELVDISNGEIKGILQGHTHGIYDLTFTSDGSHLISVSGDSTARIWDINSGSLISTLTGHSNELFAVDINEHETLAATTGWDRKIIIWDLEAALRSGHAVPVLTLSGHTDQIHALAFNQESTQLVSGSWDGTMRTWNISLQGGGEGVVFVNNFAPGPAQAVSISLGPGGQLLGFANSDPVPKLWDTATGNVVQLLQGHQAPVEEIEFSPNGGITATLDLEGELAIWDTRNGERKDVWETFDCGVYEVLSCDLAFSPGGGQLAIGDSQGLIHVFEVSTGSDGLFSDIDLSSKHQAHDDAIFELAFSPDGTSIATGSWNTTAEIWESGSGEDAGLQFDHPLPVYGVTFSPDGSLLATTSQDGNVRLWDAETGELQATLSGHTSSVYRSTFSPDGKRIASASYDGSTKVWDVSSGQELLTLEAHTKGVSDVAFSADGKRLYSASVDGSARVYLLDIDDLVALAKQRVHRQLTDTECRQYLHLESCEKP